MKETFSEVAKTTDERKRLEETIYSCKVINEWIILIFLILSGLCAKHIIPEWMMYPYILVGGIAIIISTLVLVIEETKMAEINAEIYDFEEDEDETE